jgi:drug/metabolite transporter (DMT)-like permease
LSAALLFSTGGTAIKFAELSSWQIACFRSALAALFFLALGSPWRDCLRPRVLAVGTLYSSVMILYVVGNKLTTAANTIFLQSTSLLWILLLSPILLKEKARASDLVFATTIALGMTLLLVGADPPSRTAPQPMAGNLLAALAGVGWGLSLIGLRWLARSSAPAQGNLAESAVVTGNVVACLVCLPFAFDVAFPLTAVRAVDWLVVGYLGIFQIGLAYVFMTRGVKRLSAIEVMLLLLIELPVNAFWAWLVHDERPGAWSLSGCALIFAASLGRVLWSARAARNDPAARP